MNEQHKYRSTDKMSDLICDNYSLLMVMSRFGLSLGFGDKSVKDVCEAQGVDCPTFLAVANFISEEQYSYSGNESDFSISRPYGLSEACPHIFPRLQPAGHPPQTHRSHRLFPVQTM